MHESKELREEMQSGRRQINMEQKLDGRLDGGRAKSETGFI